MLLFCFFLLLLGVFCWANEAFSFLLWKSVHFFFLVEMGENKLSCMFASDNLTVQSV